MQAGAIRPHEDRVHLDAKIIRGGVASEAEAGIRRQDVERDFLGFQRFGCVIQDALRQLDFEADAAGQGAGFTRCAEFLVGAQVSQQGDGASHHRQSGQEKNRLLPVHVVLVARGGGLRLGLAQRMSRQAVFQDTASNSLDNAVGRFFIHIRAPIFELS